jgi:hypothetical protein
MLIAGGEINYNGTLYKKIAQEVYCDQNTLEEHNGCKFQRNNKGIIEEVLLNVNSPFQEHPFSKFIQFEEGFIKNKSEIKDNTENSIINWDKVKNYNEQELSKDEKNNFNKISFQIFNNPCKIKDNKLNDYYTLTKLKINCFKEKVENFLLRYMV